VSASVAARRSPRADGTDTTTRPVPSYQDRRTSELARRLCGADAIARHDFKRALAADVKLFAAIDALVQRLDAETGSAGRFALERDGDRTTLLFHAHNRISEAQLESAFAPAGEVRGEIVREFADVLDRISVEVYETVS
jgi:hypothetical protein